MLKPIHLSLLVAVSLIVSACGANDHVTALDAAGKPIDLPSQQVAEQKAPEQQADPAVAGVTGPTGDNGQGGNNGDQGNNGGNGNNGDNGNNGNNGRNGFNGELGVTGATGKDGQDGTQVIIMAPAPTAEPTPAPTPAPIIIIEKGVNGINGKDGKDAPILCDPASPRSAEGTNIAFDQSQLNDIKSSKADKLPYLMQIKKGLAYPKLDLITIGESNKGRASSRYVEDAMVLFNIDIVLPKRKLIVDDANFSLKLNLDVYKYSVDSHLDSEMICLLDIEKCSGQEFHQASKKKSASYDKWVQMINKDFANGNPIANENFSVKLAAGIEANKTRVGMRNEYASILTLDMAELFSQDGGKLSNKDLLDLMYGNAGDNEVVTRTFHFLVADDTQVGTRTTLKLNYTHNGCAEDKVQR